MQLRCATIAKRVASAMKYQRARQPAQKADRRLRLLKAARGMLQDVQPLEFGLNALARKARMSKANVYRYFESAEDVLFSVLLEELDDLVSALERLRPQSPSALAATLVEAFAARPLLCALLGVASSRLEHNLSVEAIARTKQSMCSLTLRAARALEVCAASLSAAKAVWLVQATSMYVSALWPSARPSNAVEEVMARPEFTGFRPHFARDLRAFLDVVLAGLSGEPATHE
jgi:AcrR family transcriptional regulator